MRRPEFIFLDLGNVIVDFDHGRGFRQMSELSGVPQTQVAEFFSSGHWQRRIEAGQAGWPDLHAAFTEATGSSTDAESLARAAADIFLLRMEMVPVIAALEQTGIPLGILSNTCDIHWNHLVRSRYGVLPGGFRTLVLSHEVGAVKPEPEIFAEATRRAGVPPSSIFFCDDVLPHVESARAHGWDAEVFRSASQLIAQLATRGVVLNV